MSGWRELIQELEHLDKLATPGPWMWDEMHHDIVAQGEGYVQVGQMQYVNTLYNARLVARVRTELPRLIEGFKLLAEEHEAAGRMFGPEAHGRESQAIAEHDRKWQDADVFLRGFENG